MVHCNSSSVKRCLREIKTTFVVLCDMLEMFPITALIFDSWVPCFIKQRHSFYVSNPGIPTNYEYQQQKFVYEVFLVNPSEVLSSAKVSAFFSTQ